MPKYKFTEKWIKGLEAPKNMRLDFVDAICPGLYLRVGHSGRKSFSVLLRYEGKLQRITIGRYPRWSLVEARNRAMQLLRDADAGIDPRADKKAKPAMTFEELRQLFIDRHLKPNTRSWQNVARNLDHKMLRHLRGRDVTSVSKKEIIDVIDSIVESGSVHAAVNILRNLKMMFNWALSRDIISSNPCDRVRPPVRTTERDRVLGDKELVAIWSATFELPAPYGQMFRAFILTGQRRSEVSTMRWSDIKGDVWTIPREIVKKDRPHSVPLSQMMIDNIAELPFFSVDGYVFTTTAGRKPSSNYNKTKAELDTLSGVKDWRIHDIRRTVRSKLAELGIPREVARKILNHEDGKVDRIYNRHDYLNEKREALQKWADHLNGLVTSHGTKASRPG